MGLLTERYSPKDIKSRLQAFFYQDQKNVNKNATLIQQRQSSLPRCDDTSSVIGTVTAIETTHRSKPTPSCSGVTDNFVQYSSGLNSGFYVEVDTSLCGDQSYYRNNGLYDREWQNQPMVQTQLNCQAYCWLSTGTDAVYWLSPNTFRVYIKNQPAYENPAILKDHSWHFMWSITSMVYV